MSRETVALPKTEPTRAGLVNALGGDEAVVSSTASDRWYGGLTYWPEPCGSSTVGMGVCDLQTLDPADFPGGVNFDPFVLSEGVVVPVVRAPKGSELSYAEDLARERLLRTTSQKVEAELWSASFVGTNPSFTSDIVTYSGPTDLVDGLAVLQTFLANEFSVVGMIHASLYAVGWWRSLGLVEVDGGKLRDIYGNIIVAGSGYPTGAGSTMQVAIATGPIDLYLSPIETTDSVINEDDNTIASSANRFGAAVWSCQTAGIEMDTSSLCGAVIPDVAG